MKNNFLNISIKSMKATLFLGPHKLIKYSAQTVINILLLFFKKKKKKENNVSGIYSPQSLPFGPFVNYISSCRKGSKIGIPYTPVPNEYYTVIPWGVGGVLWRGKWGVEVSWHSLHLTRVLASLSSPNEKINLFITEGPFSLVHCLPCV